MLVRHNNVQYYYLEQDQKFVLVPDIPCDFQQQLLHGLQQLQAIATGMIYNPQSVLNACMITNEVISCTCMLVCMCTSSCSASACTILCKPLAFVFCVSADSNLDTGTVHNVHTHAE